MKIIFYVFSNILFCQGLHWALHPSVDKVVLGMYSVKKFSAIVLIIIFSVIIYTFNRIKLRKYAFLTIIDEFIISLYRKTLNNPTLICVIMLSTFFSISQVSNLTLGNDFASQLKMVTQYFEGITPNINTLSKVNIDNTSNDSLYWSIRPPCALLYYIPFITTGIPLGTSLRVANLFLGIITCVAWTKIFNFIAPYNKKATLLLCITLCVWVSNEFQYIGKVDLLITTFSAIATIAVLFFIQKLASNINNSLYHIFVLPISLILGLSCWIKISSLLYLASLFIFLMLNYIYINLKESKSFLYKRLHLLALCFFLFLTPYFLLLNLNEFYGISANNAYYQNYNEIKLYREQWGEYFMETTHYPMVLISFFGALGTFSGFEKFQILLTNSILQFENFYDFFVKLSINPKVTIKGLIGCSFTFIFCIFIYKNQKICKYLNFNFIVCTCILSITGYALISTKHEYNYLITGTYNHQHIPIFLVITCYFYVKIKKSFLNNSIFFLIYIFFTYSNAHAIYNQISNSKDNSLLLKQRIFNKFYGYDNQRVLNAINNYRDDLDLPVIFITNFTYEEVSTSIRGRFGGIILDDNNLDYSAIKKIISSTRKDTMFVLDSRLDREYIKSFIDIFNKNNIKLLLNEEKLSKVAVLEIN